MTMVKLIPGIYLLGRDLSNLNMLPCKTPTVRGCEQLIQKWGPTLCGGPTIKGFSINMTWPFCKSCDATNPRPALEVWTKCAFGGSFTLFCSF